MIALDETARNEGDRPMAPAHKERPWWMNPAFEPEPKTELDALSAFPEGSYELLNSLEDRTTAKSLRTSVDEGDYSSFATLLFMINGNRPGPVPGFYVVVEAVKGMGWCVGQLNADGATPLRVFRTPIYESEGAARQAAEKLRLSDVGNAPPRI